ncbi:unnamed protein product [Rotaria socialis]|uniref:Uncharacterized protein n=1 Tax=Rotaria socialis TaxID=392032 RepID=A0A820S415_9BILA|nr:unnamed protein product [Rotaria socialis]CAF4444349.1 unnamed protein product [Rotaria socialis]
MKDSTKEYVKQDSFTNYDDEFTMSDQQSSIKNFEKSDDSCRKLTLMDVDQALHTLKIHSNSSRKRTLSSNDTTSTRVFVQEYDCCRLRQASSSSHLLLPLARRGRSVFSSRSNRLLCSNCTKLKQQQQIDILQRQEKQKFHSNHTFQITINLDLSSEEQNALNSHQYESSKTLVWNTNRSHGNNLNLSYDAQSLDETGRKNLLDQTVKKLQIILNNQSTAIEEQNPETTSHLLQTTINILSSSQNSI